jgi:Protein of unknown function (DUF551)
MSWEPWRPIHTAPKDGTDVLCWVVQRDPKPGDEEDRGSWAVMYFDGECGEWTFPFGDDCGYVDEYGPTHWMPLPEPPVP